MPAGRVQRQVLAVDRTTESWPGAELAQYAGEMAWGRTQFGGTNSLAATLLLTIASMRAVQADSSAHFWLATSDVGPVVPTIYALPGSIGHVQVWARPDADRRLMAFSLDLEATTPGVVSFTDVDVLNPQLQAMPALYRHQLVFDSGTGLTVAPDLIDSFLGYSFFDNALGLPEGAGMGPQCGIDPQCSATSGAPSWHLATISYTASMSFGTTNLRLAIGEQGLWQTLPNANPAEEPDETSAVFGLANDTINQWDADHPEETPDNNVDHRHSPQGLADAVIRVASADFDSDGDVDGADFLTWQRNLGVGTMHSQGDADGNGGVNEVDLAAWRFQFGTVDAALPAGSAAPEPTGVVVAWAAIAFATFRRRS